MHKNQNPHSRSITLEPVTRGGAYFFGLAPSLQLQRWRDVGDTLRLDLARESNPRPLVPIAMSLTKQMTVTAKFSKMF